MGLRWLTCSTLKINYATATSIKKLYLIRLWYEQVTINQITVLKRSWTTHMVQATCKEVRLTYKKDKIPSFNKLSQTADFRQSTILCYYFVKEIRKKIHCIHQKEMWTYLHKRSSTKKINYEFKTHHAWNSTNRFWGILKILHTYIVTQCNKVSRTHDGSARCFSVWFLLLVLSDS